MSRIKTQKRIISALAALLSLCLFLVPVSGTETTSEADAPEVAMPEEDSEPKMHLENAEAFAVYNLENDTIVFSSGEDVLLPTASFTKMMTAVCAYEILADRLDETLTVEYSMIKDAVGNQVGYYVGETVSVRDMFGGLLTRGANDSALLLCYAAKGGVDEFVAYMNEKAVEYGMGDTVYKNPTGMHADGMVTTARDSITLSRRFYQNTFLTEMSNSVTYDMPENNKSGHRAIYNRNALVSKVSDTRYFDSRIVGMNAGSTTEAGYYAASALKNDMLSYIIVVLGGKEIDTVNYAYVLTSELATHAIKGYGYTEVIKTSDIICEVSVRLSTDADYVTLVPAESLTLYLPTDLNIKEDLVYKYTLEKSVLDAPVTEGQVAGKYSVSSSDGELLGTVDLVTRNSVEKSGFLGTLDSIEKFTTDPVVISVAVGAVVLVILFFILRNFMRTKRRRRNRYRRF